MKRLVSILSMLLLVCTMLVSTGCKTEVEIGGNYEDDGYGVRSWEIDFRVKWVFGSASDLPFCLDTTATLEGLPEYADINGVSNMALIVYDPDGNRISGISFRAQILEANSPRDIQIELPPLVITDFYNSLAMNPALANGGELELGLSIPVTLDDTQMNVDPFQLVLNIVCGGDVYSFSDTYSVANLGIDAMKSIISRTSTLDGQKIALYEKLDAVLKMIEEGAYEGASRKLNNDILKKVYGDKAWISDVESQEALKFIVDLFNSIM